MKKPKAIFCWSGGKDSALALYKTLREDKFEVVALLTTLNREHLRISMHGVRETLLDLQAISIGIPLVKVWVKEGTNAEYETVMEEKMLSFKSDGVTHVLFGDIFLEDLRLYRENNLKKINLQAVFPLWKMDTNALINEFIQLGFKSITCCVSSKHFDESFVGREVDKDFIQQLPANVDACGENGEFHTFCYEGPIFKKVINFIKGEKVFRPITDFNVEGDDGFWYVDLLPVDNESAEKLKPVNPSS